MYFEYKNVFDLEMSMLASSICNMFSGGSANTYEKMISNAEEREEIINF